MVMMHVWFIGLREHFGEFAGGQNIRPLFLLFGFFCLVAILGKVLGSGILAFMDWEGSASWAFLHSPLFGY